MSEAATLRRGKKGWSPPTDRQPSKSIEHHVPKLRKNRIGEERIHNEVIVDAYGPEEQALGWYYYLETK